MLALNIRRFFEEKELRAKLSQNAVKDMRKTKEISDYERINELVKTIL